MSSTTAMRAASLVLLVDLGPAGDLLSQLPAAPASRPRTACSLFGASMDGTIAPLLADDGVAGATRYVREFFDVRLRGMPRAAPYRRPRRARIVEWPPGSTPQIVVRLRTTASRGILDDKGAPVGGIAAWGTHHVQHGV